MHVIIIITPPPSPPHSPNTLDPLWHASGYGFVKLGTPNYFCVRVNGVYRYSRSVFNLPGFWAVLRLYNCLAMKFKYYVSSVEVPQDQEESMHADSSTYIHIKTIA